MHLHDAMLSQYRQVEKVHAGIFVRDDNLRHSLRKNLKQSRFQVRYQNRGVPVVDCEPKNR